MVDNLSDALIMAGSVLIFIITLTICISSFSTVKGQMDDILWRETKTDFVTDETGSYLNYQKAEDMDVRIVGVESVVSSLYKLVKENYTVYIIGDFSSNKFYDYENTSLGDKMNITLSAVYGTIPSNWDKIVVNINNKNSDIDVLLNNIYKELEDKKFYEYLGEYQDDTEAEDEERETERVITYVEVK